MIAGGKSNLTFELSSPAGELILRRPPTGQLLPRAHDMAREVTVQNALQQSAVPVPAIVLTELHPGLLDVGFYVMRRLPGTVLRDDVPSQWRRHPSTPQDATNSLIDTLADLHAIDPQKVGLEEFGRPEGFAARQVRTWQRQFQAAQTRDIAAVTELHRLLADYSWPREVRPAIVHGDYRLDNCLLDVDSGQITGVLDWELSTLGDPLCDLGMLLFYWVEAGEPQPVLTPALTAAAAFGSRRDIAHRYALATQSELVGLPAYVALAHFKFVGIAQGIAARVARGQMAGQDFGNLDDEIERIALAGITAMKGELRDGI